MAENVSEQQTNGIKDASVFSIVLDESTDINDLERSAVMARYCKILCCSLKPVTDTTKDIAKEMVENTM